MRLVISCNILSWHDVRGKRLGESIMKVNQPTAGVSFCLLCPGWDGLLSDIAAIVVKRGNGILIYDGPLLLLLLIIIRGPATRRDLF